MKAALLQDLAADESSVELHERTMQRIAKALNVGQKTISRDLEGLVTMTKPARPKGGRPDEERTRRRAGTPCSVAAISKRALEYSETVMANDQAVEDILTSLIEHVGMQMLRVEELSHRSWRYVLVATPTEDDKFGRDMRVSYLQTDQVPDDLRTFAALLEDVAQRMEAGAGD